MPAAEVLSFLSLAKPVVDLLGKAVLEEFNTTENAPLTTETVAGLLDRLVELKTLNLDDFVRTTLNLGDIDWSNFPAAVKKIEAAIESDLPAAVNKIGTAFESARELFKLPPSEKILNGLFDKLMAHNEAPPDRKKRGTLEKGVDGKLILDASREFRFWADENSLPEVEDDRENLPTRRGGTRPNPNHGSKSREIAREAYNNAWRSWSICLGISAKDSYGELLSQGPGAVAANREAEEKRANVLVKTVTTLPANYRAYTTVGGGGAASRGLEMELNGTLKWVYSEFQGTVAHEIGHLMGLDDEGNPSLLMSGVYSHVNEPQQGDIDAAKRAGWKVA